MNDDNFLTAEQVSAMLNVTERTLYRLIRLEQLPGYRVGRLWRFRKQDVESWLRGRSGSGPAASPTPRRRVLVADDDEGVLKFLSRALQFAKYDVVEAKDGASALETLKAGSFDLLITDLKMPGMHGLALIREIRRVSNQLAIVIVTAESTEAQAIEACNLRVGGYLTKPFRVQRILVAAAQALGDPEPTPDVTLAAEEAVDRM